MGGGGFAVVRKTFVITKSWSNYLNFLLIGEMRGEAAPYSLVPSEEGSLLAECHQEKVPRGWSQEKVQGAKEQGGKVYKRR